MKTCTNCGLTKSIADFHRNCRAADGFRSECKECHLRYYRTNPEYLQKSKEWHKKNPDKHNVYNKRWYEQHGKLYNREYLKANRERINNLKRLRYKKAKENATN